MRRSASTWRFWGTRRPYRGRGAPSRRLAAAVEGLESRNLLTAGSVVQTPGLIVVTPAPTGQNVTVVSYQKVEGQTMVDVSLNGTNHFFPSAQAVFIDYKGSSASGSQTFENETGIHTVAFGGSGKNVFMGGTGSDEFIGGSGANVFDAGTGFDILVGGTGPNTFNENAHGSGIISELGTSNKVYAQPGSAMNYHVSV